MLLWINVLIASNVNDPTVRWELEKIMLMCVEVILISCEEIFGGGKICCVKSNKIIIKSITSYSDQSLSLPYQTIKPCSVFQEVENLIKIRVAESSNDNHCYVFHHSMNIK